MFDYRKSNMLSLCQKLIDLSVSFLFQEDILPFSAWEPCMFSQYIRKGAKRKPSYAGKISCIYKSRLNAPSAFTFNQNRLKMLALK